jgi:hypothetical protein
VSNGKHNDWVTKKIFEIVGRPKRGKGEARERRAVPTQVTYVQI